MRKIALLIIAVCSSVWGTVSSTAQTAHFLVPFTDLGLRSNIVRSVTLTPIARTLDTAGVIRLPDPITYGVGAHPEMTNGSVTFSNRLTGYAMRFDLSTAYSVYSYTSCVPTNVTGLVNVTDYGGVIVGMVSGIVNPFAFFNPQLNAQFSNSVAAIVAESLPDGIVTNNATGVTLSGTFSGNGDSLNKTNFQSGIVVSGGAVNTISVGTNGSNNGSIGFPDVETDWGIYKTGGNLRIASGATLGGITVSNNGDLRATTFIGNASTANTATNTPSGRTLDGLIGAFTNASFTFSGSTTGAVTAANNVLNVTIGSSNASASAAAVNLASNLFNFPKEIYIVAGVYGMAYRMTPTNSGVNSAGQFYTVNPYYGNATLWSEAASNYLQSQYGISCVMDSSISHPSFGETPDIASGAANAVSPPFDRQTPTLYWLKQRSPNYTRTNKAVLLHAPQANIESATLTATTAWQVTTNIGAQLEQDGWTVIYSTFIYNYDYWNAYTNQTAGGIQASNYDLSVRQSGKSYVDFFRITTNWATRSDLQGNTNYYCGGNHIGYYTGLAIGTNFIESLITNQPITAQRKFNTLALSDAKTGWIGWQGGGSFLANSYTNERVVWYQNTNSGVVGGPQTNGYLAANMTVSNLLPNTRYEWQAGFHLQTSAKGGRWDFRTDYPYKQYDYAGRVIYNTAADIIGNSIYGASTANNTLVGGVRSIGAANDNCGALITGAFTTGTNITALQMYYAPEATNAAGSVAKTGFLRVWPASTLFPQ